MNSVTRAEDTLHLQGALTMETVPALMAQLRTSCDTSVCSVDFAKVTELDSAAVALALELRRLGSRNGSALTLHNLPDALHKLIALYDVGEHLGV